MNTTTTMLLGLLAALALSAGAAAEDAGSPGQAGTGADAACEPVWVSTSGDVHVDPGCIGPVFANSP